MENTEVHILVVDDNQENLKVVSSYLKEKNYKIALALDGTSALKVIKSFRIDLVLLDVMMPGLDGFEVCRILKSMSETQDIPIIFLTAKTDTEDIVKGFEAGGVDYIPKPFKKEELYARVCNQVQLKKLRDYLKTSLDDTRNSRAEIMKVLLDLSRIIDPQKD